MTRFTRTLVAAAVLASGSVLVPTPARGRDRLERPFFKGVEMYSWRSGQVWQFSLLVGTNRRKTRKEVEDPRATVAGVEALRARLAVLAPGEEVFWLAAPDGPSEYPSRTEVAVLVDFCKSKQVALHGPY